MTLICIECGAGAWRYDNDTLICRNGHRTAATQPEDAVVTAPPPPKPNPWPARAQAAGSAAGVVALILHFLT